MKCLGMTEHGGLKLKFERGRFQREFTVKMLYSGTARSREAAEFMENRRGRFEDGIFHPSQHVLGKIHSSNHFILCLSSDTSDKELENLKAETEAYVTENVRHRSQNEAEFKRSGIYFIRLGIVIFQRYDKIQKPVQVAMKLKLLELQKKVLEISQFGQSDQIITGNLQNYSSLYSSKFHFQWKIIEAGYDDCDDFDLLFQWCLQ